MTTQYIDVKLAQDDEGIWDITLDEDGDLTKDDGFGTTIALSIFGHRRATEGEVPTPEYRGGWIGNLLSDVPGFEAGSKSWLRQQARLTPETVTVIKNDHQEALNWLIEDGLAASVIVKSQQSGPDSIFEEIEIDGDKFYFDAWNNTRIINV